VAVFLVVTLGLFTTLILVVAGTEWLKAKDLYYIDFVESVKGLSNGSTVRYNGVPVGKVKRIKPLSDGTTRITVELTERMPIKTDSEAICELDSLIVGNRSILITPGSSRAETVPPGIQAPQYIIRGKPSTFDMMYGRAAEISAQSAVLISNVNTVFSPENARIFSSILLQIDTFLHENSTNAAQTLEDFRRTLDTVRLAIDAARIDATMTQVRNTLAQFDEAVGSATDMMAQNQRAISDTLNNLRVATDSLGELLDKLNRQPGLLIRGRGETKKEWMHE
jgi:phospholipid/cholesterol/gamma-HCH transport system substrate-binding protein